MPKPDGSKDYYGILEVANDASVEEIKKAYHKLAFKWHPDRNHGREQEAALKFQEVSNAYEILTDPITKAKYDEARARVLRKNNVTFTSPSNTYNPYANFPPARPQSSPQKSPGTAGGTSQYAQYTTQTNAPWASGGPPRTRAQAQDAYKAWDSMKGTGAPPPARGYPAPPRGAPNMPPRPKPAAFAKTSGNTGPTSKARAGWSEPEDQGPSPGRPPGPGLARANTMRSPRRNGYDPDRANGDEPPARTASAYYNVRAGYGRGGRPQSYVHPTAPLSTEIPKPPRPDAFKGFRTKSSEENFADRLSTPYATGGGEKTYFSSANLYRNPQPESASNLSSGWQDMDDHSPRNVRHRHRSASPTMRSPRAQPMEDSDTSSESSSEEEDDNGNIESRTKLRPRGYRDRKPPSPMPPPPPRTADMPPQPGLTVENEFGKVHEFSKPVKRSTWATDTINGQAQRLAGQDSGRRTSTGNIHERSHSSAQPSPLQKTTSASPNEEFEPLEKPTSWNQKYGSPKDTAEQRRFEPPNNHAQKPKYDTPFLYALNDLKSFLHAMGMSNGITGQGLYSSRSSLQPLNSSDMVDNANIDLSPSFSNAYDSADSNSPAKNDGSYFQSQNWQEKFNSNGQNPFSPTELPRQSSPVKGKNNNLRVPRKNSAPKKHTIPKPARVGSDADSVPSMSSSTESVSSGAMDIDAKTPPPPLSAKSSRPATASGPQNDDSLNLKDFTKTAPFAPNSAGLADLNDLGATLPFGSQPASTLPSEGLHVHKLILPPPPRAPKPPNMMALRQQDWEYYLVFVRKYMAEWNMFNQRMLQHFTARQYAVENELPKGWLEGIGEGGLSRYMSWMDEDTRVRSHWDVAYERHAKAMTEFQRVKKSASTAKFVSL